MGLALQLPLAMHVGTAAAHCPPIQRAHMHPEAPIAMPRRRSRSRDLDVETGLQGRAAPLKGKGGEPIGTARMPNACQLAGH